MELYEDDAAAADADWNKNDAAAAAAIAAAADADWNSDAMEASDAKMDEQCITYTECDAEKNCWEKLDCWEVEYDWQDKASDWLMDAVISYGFDPDVAEEWLEGKQETWAEIEARQREEKANQLAQDITELADESSKIFENMLDDLTSRFPDLTAMLAEELNDLADDALDEIQRAKNETQAMIEDFVADLSSNDIELKQMGETQAAANNGAYGYAALALGVAAVIAYSIRRRAINKTSGINEPLIDD